MKLALLQQVPRIFPGIYILLKISHHFMKKTSRRNFIALGGKVAALAGVAAALPDTSFAAAGEKTFVHHVYFWLKNRESEQDKQKLIAGLKKLAKVKTIQKSHIGVPAATNREVIDSSYSVSWLLFFKNKADQDSYQVDPIHLKFVEECSHLWEKVIVYDTEEI